jgi:hypothetical protein
VEIRHRKGDPLSLGLVGLKNGLTIPFRAEALSACCSSHLKIRPVVAFRSWEWSLLSKTSISADSLLPSLACIHLPPVGTPYSAVVRLIHITVRAHPTKLPHAYRFPDPPRHRLTAPPRRYEPHGDGHSRWQPYPDARHGKRELSPEFTVYGRSGTPCNTTARGSAHPPVASGRYQPSRGAQRDAKLSNKYASRLHEVAGASTSYRDGAHARPPRDDRGYQAAHDALDPRGRAYECHLFGPYDRPPQYPERSGVLDVRNLRQARLARLYPSERYASHPDPPLRPHSHSDSLARLRAEQATAIAEARRVLLAERATRRDRAQARKTRDIQLQVFVHARYVSCGECAMRETWMRGMCGSSFLTAQ